MRIDSNPGPQPAPESNRSDAQNSPAASSALASSALTGSTGALGEGALGEDQAQLSGAHTQVQALTAQAAQLPEVREDRVHSLRLAVQSGQYQTSPEQIADAVFSYLITEPAA
jgi:flagellar biosynthesis anti-sigma factor FlgM